MQGTILILLRFHLFSCRDLVTANSCDAGTAFVKIGLINPSAGFVDQRLGAVQCLLSTIQRGCVAGQQSMDERETTARFIASGILLAPDLDRGLCLLLRTIQVATT